jgi:hypothetical protein
VSISSVLLFRQHQIYCSYNGRCNSCTKCTLWFHELNQLCVAAVDAATSAINWGCIIFPLASYCGCVWHACGWVTSVVHRGCRVASAVHRGYIIHMLTNCFISYINCTSWLSELRVHKLNIVVTWFTSGKHCGCTSISAHHCDSMNYISCTSGFHEFLQFNIVPSEVTWAQNCGYISLKLWLLGLQSNRRQVWGCVYCAL